MSLDASRARSTGPFVQIVASATWLSAIDGFRSTASSSSTCVGSASCGESLPELLLGVLVDRVRDLDVLPLHVQTHRASSIRVSQRAQFQIYRTEHAGNSRSPPSLSQLRSGGSSYGRAEPGRRGDSCRVDLLRVSASPWRNRRPRRDARRPCGALCGGARGRAARVDVVDEADRSRRRAHGAKRAADVAAPLDEAEPALAPRRRRRAPAGARRAAPRRRPSSRASCSAGWCPRRRRRSPSGGTNASRSTSGRGTVSATSAAASAASRRRPRSFQPPTIRRTASSYSTAARADAKPSRRPAHSRQRSTGQTVGAPQRAQSGGTITGSASRQRAQSCEPGRRQARQRCGKRRSSRPRR